MAPGTCSNCPHELAEHDATGICGKAPCSCIADPRSPVRLDRGPLKAPFSDLPRLDSFAVAGARGSSKNALALKVWIGLALAAAVLFGVLKYLDR